MTGKEWILPKDPRKVTVKFDTRKCEASLSDWSRFSLSVTDTFDSRQEMTFNVKEITTELLDKYFTCKVDPRDLTFQDVTSWLSSEMIAPDPICIISDAGLTVLLLRRTCTIVRYLRIQTLLIECAGLDVRLRYCFLRDYDRQDVWSCERSETWDPSFLLDGRPQLGVRDVEGDQGIRGLLRISLLQYSEDRSRKLWEKSEWTCIMWQFGCSVTSTWLRCDDRLENDLKKDRWRDREIRRQLDFVIVARNTKVETHIYDEERLRAWDQFSVSVTFKWQEDKVKIDKGTNASTGRRLKDAAEIKQYRRGVTSEEDGRKDDKTKGIVWTAFTKRLRTQRERRRHPHQRWEEKMITKISSDVTDLQRAVALLQDFRRKKDPEDKRQLSKENCVADDYAPEGEDHKGDRTRWENESKEHSSKKKTTIPRHSMSDRIDV